VRPNDGPDRQKGREEETRGTVRGGEQTLLGVQPSESAQRKRRDRAGMTNCRKVAVAPMRPFHWPISITVADIVNAVTMSRSTSWAHGVVHGWT
jgi:hypothetical protein